MSVLKSEIKQYENKMRVCSTMTELLMAMSSWQSFADSHGLTKEERASVDDAYIQAEAELITKVKPTLW